MSVIHAPMFSGNDFSMAFQGIYTNLNASTSVTYPSCSIGNAGPSRLIVVVLWQTVSSNWAVSSMTIGGITATQHVASQLSEGSLASCKIFSAPVPTGTTATVAISWDGPVNKSGIAVYALHGVSLVNDTASSYNIADPHNLSVDTTSQCFVVAGAVVNGGLTATWTGVTQDAWDSSWSSPDCELYCASATVTTAETPRVVYCDDNGLQYISCASAVFKQA